MAYTQTFTLTFGDVAENHKGMQQIGNLSDHGFNKQNLDQVKEYFDNLNVETKMIHLNEYLLDDVDVDDAYVLVVKNGVNCLLNDNNGANNLYEEQDLLNKDKKAFMYGRVVNKHARHNLCFAEENQEPDYENGKGRVIAFNEVPLLQELRQKFGEILEEASNLQVEGNYYYDLNKCGIGFHGDAERRKVIGVRLGATIPLVYVWYYNCEPVSEIINTEELKLEHGDIYFMSEKATGFDWKKKIRYTLRHAAGAEKYITI
jgi:hypothetical protein